MGERWGSVGRATAGRRKGEKCWLQVLPSLPPSLPSFSPAPLPPPRPQDASFLSEQLLSASRRRHCGALSTPSPSAASSLHAKQPGVALSPWPPPFPPHLLLHVFFIFLFFLERDDGRGELVAPLYILKQTRLLLIFSSSLFFFFSLVPTRPPPISISGRHTVATHRETQRRGRERQFYGGWKESGSGDGRGGGDASQGQSVIKKRKFIVEGFFLIMLLCRLGFARCIFFLEREKDNWKRSRSARVKGHRVVCCQIVSKPFSFVENISYLHFFFKILHYHRFQSSVSPGLFFFL